VNGRLLGRLSRRLTHAADASDRHQRRRHHPPALGTGTRRRCRGRPVWQTQVESNQGEDLETYIAQSGALADTKATVEGQRVYDATAVDCPTLVVGGDEDAISVHEDAVGLFDELDCRKEYAEIGGDHYVMHGESRQALYDAVSAFQDRV
jgi:alpha-beta hydrolase superfamily lysophospholipase